MIKFFLSIYDKLSSHKWLVGITIIVILAVCFALTSQMHYKEDVAEFLPHNEQSDKYSSVYNHLGGQNRVVVIFSEKKGKNIDGLIEAMEEFGTIWEQADTSKMVKDLQVHVDETKTLEMMNFIWTNYPYFLTPEDYRQMDSLLSVPNYVSQQMVNNKSLLMLPASGVMTQNLRYDPLHLFSAVGLRLKAFNIGDQFQVINGCVFTKEGDKGLVFMTSPFGISESKQNEKLAELIDVVIHKTEKLHSDVNISAIGAPLIAVANSQQIKKDSFLAVSLAVILIFAILIFSFRRFDDLFWIGASILFGWFFALGCIALYKDSISIIVLGIGSVIIGIAVNYPLHFLDHLKHEQNRRIALKEMIPPLLIGNITTVSAFLCLLFINAESMRDLGLFGSLTLIGTILFVLVFLPILVSKRKLSKKGFNINLDRVFPLSGKKKNAVLVPLILLTAVLFVFSLNTSFDSDLRNINYMTDQQKSDLNLLASSAQQNDTTKCLYAVAEGKNIQEALQNNERLSAQLKYQTQHVQTVKINGINDFIPSVSLQKERLKQWNVFWAAHPNVVKELESECVRLGFSAQAFSPFIESVAVSYSPQQAAYFQSLIQSVGANFIITENSNVRIVNYVYLPTNEISQLKKTLDNIISSDCFVFDSIDVSNQLVSILSDSFNYIGFVCGFVVFFFLWVSFGRLELSLLSFLPLAVGWIWILGIMDILGIQFNIVNIILATFIFGQGDDYTIFITEGLMYEYAYGKKTLASYKNSVALSAIIMFIGIGTLIFARHPAMRSLAEVAIIGMVTVVAMAYYLPPLVFNWITKKKSEYRQVPVTLKRWAFSAYSFLFFLFAVYLLLIPFVIVYFHCGKNQKSKQLRYHKLLRSISEFVIRRVPGVKFTYNNDVKEHFDKPAVIICNHQSHLDLMCVMMLTPKLVVLTNDWVWNNPFYGMIIKYAEFYPVSNGLDVNLPRLQSLVDRGYSIVVFPEGTRSADCSIQRFHQGAFYLSEKLRLDILPVFIHGVGHVLPKNDFMLREGSIYVEVNERVSADEVMKIGNCRQIASQMHRMYCLHYNEICHHLENADYFMPYVRYKYMYKGNDVEKQTHSVLKKISSFTNVIDKKLEGVKTVQILNSGQGEFAWLLALVHKDVEIYAFERDNDSYLLASHGIDIPKNLHFIHQENESSSLPDLSVDLTIDLESIFENNGQS